MSTMANGTRTTPSHGFQFTLHTVPNADGFNYLPEGTVGFSRISGLASETEAVDYKEGNDIYISKLPGRTMVPEITISRAVDENNNLRTWRALIEERQTVPLPQVRCTCVITIYRRSGAPNSGGQSESEIVQIWEVRDAWPKSLTLGDLDTSTGEVLTQDVVICGDGPAQIVFPQPGTNLAAR